MSGATIFLLLGLGVCAALLARNQAVFSVRMSFIRQPGGMNFDLYKLPSYDEMLLNPRHWGRWTSKQWRAYVDRQEAAR